MDLFILMVRALYLNLGLVRIPIFVDLKLKFENLLNHNDYRRTINNIEIDVTLARSTYNILKNDETSYKDDIKLILS